MPWQVGLGLSLMLEAAAMLGDGRLASCEFAPHEWLFPRVVCAVHHGGAGTTGAAFRAGVPQARLTLGCRVETSGCGLRRSRVFHRLSVSRGPAVHCNATPAAARLLHSLTRVAFT
jgi:hypothetical protein